MNPFLLVGGLVGAAGVALSAAAAHAGGGNVGIAANFLLFHAPLLVAVGLPGQSGKMLRVAALIVLIGLLVFTGDLLARDYLGDRLFPMAAPTGGTLMILGWLMVAASAFQRRSS